MSVISQLSVQEGLRATRKATAPRAKSGASSVTTAARPRQSDAITLSELARLMSAATSAVASAPEVREDRVSAIKASIAGGAYPIDSRQLARKLV